MVKKSNKNIFFFTIFSISLILDILSKYLINLFQPNFKVLPFFAIVFIKNEGAGFGLFRGQFLFLTIVSILFLGIIAYYYKKIENNKLLLTSISLACAGALGNLIDRISRGFVIDFLDLFYNNFHWPAFNIADVSLVSGMVLYIIYSYKEEKKENKDKKKRKK
ncbi:signal peptidase II [Candidatus Woesearchaeota archaeon]|nr:signal peptidase II [Candidatus Woesearchaeota archaeon]